MSIFKRKKPFVTLQYEEQFIPQNYSEPGSETGAKFENELIGNNDLQRIHAASADMNVTQIISWLREHVSDWKRA